ncbi:Extracellular membrane protein, CFEM domain, fungi [Penicillium italicum]|uniref:Extracellular membrane protein, CFEM domain, fungi n=1 Tax=Penicillium italicum TaxID=40296 RepID=A0A0A2L8Q4_PENIT|nr:Extracellular membrane protein, CFEM domain, fungi [Penicillium italicum]
MKFSTTLIAFVAAGLASAQLPDVPACSLSCFLSALQGDGCSELLDFKCHCQKPELVTSIAPCVQKACEVKDQISVSNAVVGQCSSAGHPISIPPIETGASSSASKAASTSSSVPAETSAETTASATPTTSASESSSAVESSSSAVETKSSTTAAAGTTTTGSTHVSSSSGVATSVPLVTKTDSAPTSSSSPAFNGAANVKGNMAGVAVLAAAAAYVL